MSQRHRPYQEKLKHPEDFKVKYRFYTEAEGGRKTLPFQGLRCDFWYESDKHTLQCNFMIWPEFENEKGELIESGTALQEGIARMWIINNEQRTYHRDKIQIGTKAYFMEGFKSAECEVSQIVGLNSNPIQ